ncbi:DUF2066 domain-containing protein [Shewanella amazonensis]|uniref:DUF2066 domain-containing protein n=1 Tax=Shewanella amazonensis (strain ATCC BAA-1098 / SB2B) TaxID=326297 RepID=A1S6W6_SHEAM|nr:DUF2066 domain-containing protein [Shewanella amazonensis]ABM00123.1 conserved hypothetical protein [Shewanella amazonensis SB2B]
MMKSFLKVALGLGLLFGHVGAEAVQVSRLNEADVAVSSRSSAELEQAIKDALAKVLVKNSGSTETLVNAEVQSLIAQARSVLSQYGYVENDGRLYVRASFDNTRVTSTLRSAQLPVWGKQRPLTLLWLATDGEGEKVLLGDQSDLAIRSQFNDASAQAGVPLLFPLLDLDDMMAANINSVRGFFADEVAQASRRYQSDFFALATLEAAGSGYEYRLALYPRQAQSDIATPLQSVTQVEGSADNLDSAISAILSGMSSFYVSRYAVTGTSQESETELVFTGVDRLKAVVDIETYLGQLSMVKSARLVSIEGDSLRFALTLFGSEDELRRTLALEPRLQPQGGTENNSQQGEGTIVDPFATAVQPGEILEVPGVPVQPNRYQWRGQ